MTKSCAIQKTKEADSFCLICDELYIDPHWRIGCSAGNARAGHMKVAQMVISQLVMCATTADDNS